MQTWEFAQQMRVDKTLLYDLSHLYNTHEESNKRRVFDYADYPNAQISTDWTAHPRRVMEFLDGLDYVYTAETTYGHRFTEFANMMGVKVVVHSNPEFCDYIANPRLPFPYMLACPTGWLYDRIPEPKMLLPNPVATERFTGREGKNSPAVNFLHIVGRPAANDRNGTETLLQALPFVKSNINLTIRCLDKTYAQTCMNRMSGGRVSLYIPDNEIDDYWNLYTGYDVLIMPRRWGGMSLPIQEAMGAGMPVILGAHDIYAGQLPYDWSVASKYSGQFQTRTMVDMCDCDPVALAQAIDRFATDEQFARMGYGSAETWAERHSWGALKPQYDSVFS